MNYIKGLDTLRAFAVTLVLIWHFVPGHAPYTLAGKLEQFLIPSGVFGVTLFFVLSGYLITGILLRARQESTNRLRIAKHFIVRRALRIFPIYYLLLFILLLTSYQFSKGELPYLFTYTTNFYIFKTINWSNFAHSWSLSVEEQFYLIWPWFVLFVSEKFMKYLFLVFIFIGIISSFIVSHTYASGFNNPANVLTTSCFDAFGIGGLYAYLTFIRFDRQIIKRTLQFLFILALVVSFYWKCSPYLTMQTHFIWLNRTISSLLSIYIIDLTLNNQSDFLRRYFFENRFFNLIGKVSYGMYLYHWPLGKLFGNLTLYLNLQYPSVTFINNNYALFPIKFSIVFLVSYVSFELVEKKILKFKEHFIYS